MSSIYGLEDTQVKHDPWIQLGEDTLQIANEVFDAGLHPVDLFPFLKYIPAWLPGAAFKRKAMQARSLQIRARENPFAWVKAQLAAGTATPSITAALLDARVDGSPVPEDIIKNSAGIAYIAGADTTLSTLKSFILAMVLHPETQRKAQAELDRVIPADRLPSLADRDDSKLPYLEAVLRETYRKFPSAPLGIAHTSMQDDIYEGMRIPADTIVISNIGAILQDERTFPQPGSFRPERFLKHGCIDPHVSDPRSAVICPGRYFTDGEIWLMMARVLYCFNILPALDDAGKEISPIEAVTKGAVVAPVEFQSRILPRSDAKKSLVLEASENIS
ncbi:cytochrome P450 [Auricularia subglabra TFB-10046 SS5]|nr:cytochrome P450 [Auricularia subglabra TFB-10046 SS5]